MSFNLLVVWVEPTFSLLCARLDARRSPSCGGSDDTAILRASPASATSRRCERCEYRGTGVLTTTRIHCKWCERVRLTSVRMAIAVLALTWPLFTTFLCFFFCIKCLFILLYLCCMAVFFYYYSILITNEKCRKGIFLCSFQTIFRKGFLIKFEVIRTFC